MAVGTIVFYANGIWGAGYSVTAEPSVVTQGYACSGAETSDAVYDLVDAKRGTVVTVDTNGETTDFQLDLDLTASIASSDFMILDNHNFGSADGDLTFRYAAGNTGLTVASCHSGTLGSALTAMSLGGGTEFVITNDGILLEKHTAQSSANFNVLCADNNTFTADVTLGEWFVGKSFTPAMAPDQPEIIRNFDGISVSRTLGGQNSSVKRYGKRQAWKLTWPIVEEADKILFETLLDTIEGPRFPFYIDLGEEATPCLYFVRYVENSFNVKKLKAQAYKISMYIESEV